VWLTRLPSRPTRLLRLSSSVASAILNARWRSRKVAPSRVNAFAFVLLG
jgi:hypothetical protein